MNHKGKKHNLFKIDKPDKPHVVLEGTSKEKGNCGLHLISLEGNEMVRLGRGHESDVRISDISVSRCHAMIKFKNGRFMLEDNNSKFGTLIRVN